jgi:hypothetical protein
MSWEPGSIRAGALVGYVASRSMDQATTWFYGRQTDASKQREEELAPGGTLVQFGKQLGQAAGRDLTEAEAGRVGLAVHRTFGVLYGMGAAALVKRGVRPMTAGLAVGTAAWVIVDEGTAISQFTAYPMESHMRGVVGHATLGLAVGVLLSLLGKR